MENEIRVHVVDRGRRYLYLRYICPETGKPVEKSAKTNDPKSGRTRGGQVASRAARGPLSKTVAHDVGGVPRILRDATRCRLGAKHRVGLRSHVQRIRADCDPQKLSDVTTARVTAFVTSYARQGRAEATIAPPPAAPESDDALGTRARVADRAAASSLCRSGSRVQR